MNAPDFDLLARPYRWLEYLALGPVLQRTRTHHLRSLTQCRSALLLGDGDGRFTAALLRQNPALHAHAVDLSSAMLAQLRQHAVPNENRLTTTRSDLRLFHPTSHPDLIVTHFVLDCLTQPEVDTMITRLVPHMRPDALWLVSDFRIPEGLLAIPARLYIRGLYAAFRLLTGLRVTHLPDHALALRRAGLIPVSIHRTLSGLLTTELWQSPRNNSTAQPPRPN